jgi:hypothetical protein
LPGGPWGQRRTDWKAARRKIFFLDNTVLIWFKPIAILLAPKLYFQMPKISALFLIFLYLSTAHGRTKKVIQVGIGTQDTTINCAAGGPVQMRKAD